MDSYNKYLTQVLEGTCFSYLTSRRASSCSLLLLSPSFPSSVYHSLFSLTCTRTQGCGFGQLKRSTTYSESTSSLTLRQVFQQVASAATQQLQPQQQQQQQQSQITGTNTDTGASDMSTTTTTTVTTSTTAAAPGPATSRPLLVLDFVNRVFNNLNWAVTEFVVATKEWVSHVAPVPPSSRRQQSQSQSPIPGGRVVNNAAFRSPEAQQLLRKCTVMFELSVNLLRVCDMHAQHTRPHPTLNFLMLFLVFTDSGIYGVGDPLVVPVRSATHRQQQWHRGYFDEYELASLVRAVCVRS